MQRYFKPETYIGRLLMKYLNTYVVLRDDQVAMSLWDGDVTLNQVELRCEAFDHIIPLPVAVRSGRVHELRVHVPWTKLNSDSIIISLHTVECIISLQKSTSTLNVQNTFGPTHPFQVSESDCTEEISISSGYLQSYLNRLLSNIRFVVYNLNLKFIQDNIVLSLSASAVDFYPAGADWKPTFHSYDQKNSFFIHRKLQLSDVTVCLDRSGPTGYVEVYEEPLVHRFGLCCLMEFVYPPESTLPFFAAISTLEIHSQNLELRLSPHQIHSLLRLLEVFSAVHSETVDWSKFVSANFPSSNLDCVPSGDVLPPVECLDLKATHHGNQQQSWASWVWSLVPSILPPNLDLSDSDCEDGSNEPPANVIVAWIEFFDLVCEEARHQHADPTNQFVSGLQPSIDYSDSNVPPYNSSDVRPSSVSTAHVNLRCMRRNRRRIRQLTSLCEIPPLIRLCVRCDRLTIQLTLPDYDLQPHLLGHGPKRPPVRLQPIMEFIAQGLISQSSIFGSYFTSFQLGIKQLSAHIIGNHCTCGDMDECLSTATGTTDTLPNYGKVNEDGSVVLPAFAEFGTAHGCSSSQPPNDRFLFYSMFHSNSNVTLPGVLPNEQRDSPSNQCVLQLDSYFSKFTDTVVLEHYPALWFDLVNSMEYDAPTFKSTETARTSSLETRQFPYRVVIRLLSTEIQLHISASLLHRLEAVVASIRSHPNYPACSIDPSSVCERSEALSGQPQLTRFGGHVPVQMFRLATSSAHVHFHVIHSASQPVDARSLILHLGPLECMHICPLHPEEITAELRHWDFVPHLIYHVNDLLSDDTSWLSIPPHPITRRAPDLDTAALLSHAFRRTRVRFHSCSVQMSPILSALNTPIVTVSQLTVLWWNLNAPEQWTGHPQAASIPETEIRLYIQDQVAISLSATNLLFINFLLGPIVEQLRSFGDFLSKPAAAPVHSSPYLPASLMLQRLNYVHSARPIDLGTLCIEMPGSFHMHSSFNQLRWRFCMNLDGDLNAYLLCSGTNIVVIPVLQRLKQTEASVSHHPHSHGSRQSETTTSSHSTLFDLSLQFPSKLGQDSSSIPALCQIFVSGFAGTLSPYLIRWLSSVDLPPTMFDLEALRCDQMRNHSKSLPPASLTCPKPSVSLNPSFYQRTQSVHRYSCGHPNFAISPHASTIWPRFQTLPTENDISSNTHADDWVHSRFTLIGIQELLKLLTVELVLKPWKLTILRPDYDLTSAGSLSAGLTGDYCASVDFFSPEIVMDNSEHNPLPYPATGQPDQPHIDPTRSGIPEAIKVAPPLNHPSTAHGFPSSMAPWRLRASRATVFVDRQMVLAIDLVASFLITSCQSPRGCGKFGSDQTCTTWCLHLEFSYDDPSDSPSKEDAAVSGIPSLEHILCVGQAVLYAFESLQSVAFKWTRLIRALRDVNNVDFSTTMNARISKHTDPILPSSVSNIVQKPVDIATPNSTVSAECFSKVVLATPVWSLTSNTPPLRFVVIGSLSHASGCFRTRSLDSVDLIVRWFITDVAASTELQQRRFSLDLSVGALSVYLHQSGSVVPLLTPSGSWLRRFDDGDRHNPLPNGSFTNSMLSIEGSPFAGPNTIDSAEFQWVPRFPSETPCFTCTSQKCPKISPLEVTAPSDVMFATRLSISSGPQTHECSASTQSQHCDPLCSAYSTAVCGCPVVLLDAILQPLDVVIPLELIKCVEILDQWSTNSLPECHHAGAPCGQLEENSSVSFHGSYVIHPRLLVKLLRIFVIFAKDSRAYCTPSILCEPNTLVLCSDNFEFRPLVDSQREHPTTAQSVAAERRQYSACIPNTSSLSSKNADRFTSCSAVIRGITCWMTEFASVLLPEEFIHYRWKELATKRFDGPATLQQQYPAHYWNRGLLCASRKCHPYPAPGWLLIQSFSLTFSWAPTFPAMDLSSGSGSGSSLELLISDPLVLFADNTVVKALQTVLVSNITNSGRAESHGDFGCLKAQTSFLSRFFPQRLVIDLLHIRFTCWSDAMPDEHALSSFAQMVIDLNQAHLAVRLPAPNHLAIEASICNTQMDLRFSGSHMPPSQSQLNGWSQFSPITPKEPHDSVVLILPPFPTDRVIARFSPPPMETVTFIGSAREKCDTEIGSATSFLTVCVTVDHVDDGDCALEPAVASNAARPDFVAHGKVIDITISVGNVAHAVVQPETLGAMVTLTKSVSPDTHEPPMSYSIDQIDVEHSPSATSVLFRLAVQIDGLDLRILSASLRSDRGGELRLTLRQLTCDTLAVTNLGTLANNIKWRLTTSSVHLGCVSYHPISTEDSSTLLSSRSISLLWPHTSLTCIGAARVAPCFHQLSSLTAPKYLTDLEVVVLLAAGCQTDVPLYGPTLDTLIHIILSYSNNTLLSVPLKQPVHSEFCFQCAGLQPIMHRDDLRQSLLGLSAWELTSLRTLDSVRPTPISLHLDACWPWEPNHSNLSQAPLFAHRWPKVGQLVFCDNLRGEFQVSTDLRPCTIDVADEESESQWVGLTWAYPEPRTPVHLRVIPIPLCFIERYSPSAFPQGLQLPCYLQYWDHSQLPRGSFVTYATFSLRDNQAVDVFLMNTRRFHKSYLDSTGEVSHFNHMGSHLWRQVRDNLDSLIHQSSYSSEFPTPVWSDIHRDDPDLFDLDGSDSTPAEQIWRILVDLRARPAPVFQSPSSAHGTFHATTVTSSEPVALVHISPLALGGSVELDSVQKRSIIPNAGLRGQIYCPSLRCSVIQQTYSSNSIWTANSELARLEFSNLLFSLAHPLEHWTLVSPQHVITLSWAHSLLSIADPNWSCTQPILSVQSFHGAFQLSDRGRPADIKVRSSDVHLFVGVDRLHSLNCLHSVVKHLQQRLAHLVGSSECSFNPSKLVTLPPLHWLVINHSDQIIFLQQLGSRTHSTSFKADSSREIQTTDPFLMEIRPSECVPWRPILLPSFCPNSSIRLRFGIKRPADSASTLSEPIELAWPPYAHIPQSTTSSYPLVIRLEWKDSHCAQHHHPNILVIFDHPGPCGVPGRVILHSDVILRNLLPLDFHCVLSSRYTSSPNASDAVPNTPDRVVRIQRGPSEQFLSTCSLSPLASIWVSLKFSGANIHESDGTPLYSDSFFFCIPTPTSDRQKCCTSRRSLLSVPTVNLCGDATCPDIFCCVVTVEFRVFNPSSSIVSVITISPIFQVVNQLPFSFNLNVRFPHLVSSHASSPVQPPSRVDIPQVVFVPSATRALECSTDGLQDIVFPETIVTPFLSTKSAHVILTAVLRNASTLLPEPIHLTPDGILSKLSANFVESTSRAYDSCSPGCQVLDATGVLSMETYGLRYPCHRLKSLAVNFHSADNGDEDVESVTCYTLRLLMHPERRLYNASGLDLLVSFTGTECGDASRYFFFSLTNQSQIVPPKLKKLIVRIGYAANDRVSWSSSGFMLDEAKPASRDIAGLTVVCSVPMDVTLDDCSNSHGPDILESLGSKAFSLDPPPGEIEQIPRDGFIRLTIATESSLISLLVRRMNFTEPLGPDSYPMGDILLIESLVSVRCVSSCSIRITPILFPVCDHPEEVVTQVSISKLLHDSVPFCKPMKTSPLPRWFLSHPGLYNANGFGLSGCLLLSSESGETPLVPVLLHSFLSIFTMDSSNYGNSHPETRPRVQLVSFPSDERPDPVPKLIVLTHAPASTGKVIIDFIDFAYDPSVLPTALRIVNKTDRADLCVNLCDPHWSVLDRKQHDSWHRALSDTRWTLNAHNGALVWIPESTVRDMYISDDSFSISTDAGVSPFLSPSSLGDVVLSVGCRSADGRSTVTGVDLGTLFASGSGLAIGLPDSTSIHLFGLWDPQLGTTVLIYSEPQHLTLNDEVSVTPLATYSLTCGQFSVSLLTCKPLWPLETRYGAPTNLCSTFTPQPPKDECVRLVMRGLRIDSYMATSPTPLCDVNIRLRHLQLDNWAQKWTHAYDFPVLLRSNTSAVLCIRIQSPHFSLQPVVFSAFLYPPQLDLYIEDTAVHEFSDLLLDYYHTLSRARTANLPGDRLIVHSQPLYLKCLHIASCTVLLTLRATLRVYLSCHEAPVTLAAFSLRSIDGGRHGSGYALKLVSLRRLLTMHYVSEVIFRAGWLVGSLDMLGNVTGLLHSLTDGLRDLVHMRRSQARNHLPDLVPVDPSTADTSKVAVSLITNTTNSSEYVVVMGDVSKNSPSSSTHTDVELIPTQDTAPFCRIFHGLTSLNRHATGGLLRSLTGAAASIARNLDYLSLDAQHRERQEYARRKQLPRGFTEGVQQGLSGLGLCLLSAVAGVADHPLQVFFQALDGPEQGNKPINECSNILQPGIVWTALGGLGRGLIGAVVKPVAGMAEFIARTGTGLLRSGDFAYTAVALERLNEPYSYIFAERASRHFATDTMVLRAWAFHVIQESLVQAGAVKDELHHNLTPLQPLRCFPDHSVVWMSTAVSKRAGVSETEAPSFDVLWLVCEDTSSLIVAYPDDREDAAMHCVRVAFEDVLSCDSAIGTAEHLPTQLDTFSRDRYLLSGLKLSSDTRHALLKLGEHTSSSSVKAVECGSHSSSGDCPTAPCSSSAICEVDLEPQRTTEADRKFNRPASPIRV